MGIDGSVRSNLTHLSAYSVFPTLYLKSTVQIIDGNGAQDNPYILSIK